MKRKRPAQNSGRLRKNYERQKRITRIVVSEVPNLSTGPLDCSCLANHGAVVQARFWPRSRDTMPFGMSHQPDNIFAGTQIVSLAEVRGTNNYFTSARPCANPSCGALPNAATLSFRGNVCGNGCHGLGRPLEGASFSWRELLWWGGTGDSPTGTENHGLQP